MLVIGENRFRGFRRLPLKVEKNEHILARKSGMSAASGCGDASSGGCSSRLISLAHIKRSAVPAAPKPLALRIAHPGGRIVSNAEEATVRFLRRRLAAGAELTAPQRAYLESHRELVLSEPLPQPPPAAVPRQAPAAVGKKRQREIANTATAPVLSLTSRLDMPLGKILSGRGINNGNGNVGKSGGDGGSRGETRGSIGGNGSQKKRPHKR